MGKDTHISENQGFLIFTPIQTNRDKVSPRVDTGKWKR